MNEYLEPVEIVPSEKKKTHVYRVKKRDEWFEEKIYNICHGKRWIGSFVRKKFHGENRKRNKKNSQQIVVMNSYDNLTRS